MGQIPQPVHDVTDRDRQSGKQPSHRTNEENGDADHFGLPDMRRGAKIGGEAEVKGGNDDEERGPVYRAFPSRATGRLVLTSVVASMLSSSVLVCSRADRRLRQTPTASLTMSAPRAARIRRARGYSRQRYMQFADEAAPWPAAAGTTWR